LVYEKSQYIFGPAELGNAHRYCINTTEFHLRQGLQSVVICNTFTQYWEMVPYFELAKKYEVKVKIIEMKGKYKNIHNTPSEKLEEMEKRWESYELI
jgi:hypothetical protein